MITIEAKRDRDGFWNFVHDKELYCDTFSRMLGLPHKTRCVKIEIIFKENFKDLESHVRKTFTKARFIIKRNGLLPYYNMYISGKLYYCIPNSVIGELVSCGTVPNEIFYFRVAK